MQIRNRLTFQFLALVATILFCSLLAVYSVSAGYREDAFYIRLGEKAFTYANIKLDAAKKDSNLLVVINRAKKDAIYKEYGIVFDSTGNEVYPKKEVVPYERPAWVDAIQERKWFDEIRKIGTKKLKYEEYEIFGSVYRDEECQDEYIVFTGAIDLFGRGGIRNLRNTLIMVFFVVVFAAAVSGWVFAGRALSPISSVINQVDSISVSNLSQRLDEPENKDEIHRLSATFNMMLSRIENAFKIQKTFVANASHELKNMLTVITAQLEVAEMKDRSVEEYKKTLHSVLEDIRNLNDVSYRLLELAKISGDEKQVQFELIRLDEIIWQARTDTLKRNEKYRVSVQFMEIHEDDDDLLLIKGNEALLKTAFLNLMENACKFSPNNEVIVRLGANLSYLTLEFEDKGIGIPENELPYIFEPFYRSQNTRNIKGHGIGLSLVARIIRIHNGIIDVNSKEGKGTTFKIVFIRK